MAGAGATARAADDQSDRANDPINRSRAPSSGAMSLQSSRGYDASPQMFVRLSGSHLAKPRAA